MNLNYNTVLKIFIRFYKSVNTMKNINGNLLSIINPEFSRLFDSDFAYELSHAKRNLNNSLFVEIAKKLDKQTILERTNKTLDVFNNNEINQKIKYIINKVIADDKSSNKENIIFENEKVTINGILDFSFDKYLAYLIAYVVKYTKCNLNKPFLDDDIIKLETLYQKDMTDLFLDTNKPILKKYLPYYENAVNDTILIKTIIYNNEPINLYDIYVAPDLNNYCSTFSQNGKHSISGEDVSTKKYIETFGKYTSISAPAGFGKSLFLKFLFSYDLMNNLNENEKTNLVPVYIPVRQFIKEDKNLVTMLYSSILQYMEIELSEFLKDLKKGGFLLLFDGLDEIKITQRDNFFDELNELSVKYPKNYFITASRPSEASECLNKFKNIQLARLTIKSACKLIDKFSNFPTTKKKDFIEILKNGEFQKNKNIASNPLLLTIMFMIFINKGKIPSKTYEFYDQSFQVLYEEHDKIKGYKNKKFATNLKKAQFINLLSEFCFRASTNEDYSFSIADITKTINETAFKGKVNADDFIVDLKDNLGLFYLEDGKYNFLHRSYQEYFTANYFKSLSIAEYPKVDEWFRRDEDFSFTYVNFNEDIFFLLYEMDSTRLTQYVIKPALRPYFNKTMDYWYFLKTMFPKINYGKTAFMFIGDKICQLVLAKDFGDSFISLTNYPLDLPSCDAFYYFTDNDTLGTSSISKTEILQKLKRMKTDTARKNWLKKLNIDIDTPDELLYSFKTEDIINNPKEYESLVTYLKSKKCLLFKIYNNFKKIYTS